MSTGGDKDCVGEGTQDKGVIGHLRVLWGGIDTEQQKCYTFGNNKGLPQLSSSLRQLADAHT